MILLIAPILSALLIIVNGAPALQGGVPTTPGECLTSCYRRPNGDYQSCLGCNVYASCSDFHLTDNRPCASNLVWDDILKRCEYNSSTCSSNSSSSVLKAAASSTGTCITSCNHTANGDYQSCLGCNVYATCFSGHLNDNRPCPDDLVWDDSLKRCERTSSTCSSSSDSVLKAAASSTGTCITNCSNKTDGNYQSCLGCDVYASCSGGHFTDNQTCPDGLVWDDSLKRCEYTSSTCSSSSLVLQAAASSTGACITSCEGESDGNYQSCLGCNVYATCSNGYLIDNRRCAANLVWEDRLKQCKYRSSTCPVIENCITTCKDEPDGTYQYCFNCQYYIQCSNNILYYNKCPSGTYWDNDLKHCTHTSSTCHKSGNSGNNGGNGGSNDGSSGSNGGNGDSNGGSGGSNGGTGDSNGGSGGSNGGTGVCITSCADKSDGDYQSCNGCDVYATCSNGNLIDNRPCAQDDTVWDDNIKRCEHTSSTCSSSSSVLKTAVSSTGACITSCQGKANGDYQSCQSCHVYATCSNNIISDNRPCPAHLVWNDHLKRCEDTSSTCPGDKIDNCTTSCKDKGDGNYQACWSCHFYIQCSSNELYLRRCPPGTYWDENLKHCTWTSSTCPRSGNGDSNGGSGDSNGGNGGTNDGNGGNSSGNGVCITSCDGKSDGDYQSCNGCNVYASCTNGILIDNRPCAPGETVWDDNKKQCVYTSDTCNTVVNKR